MRRSTLLAAILAAALVLASCAPGPNTAEKTPNAEGHTAGFLLGTRQALYENGRGTKIDLEKANELYRKASVQGDALAIGNLGMLYVRGQGVKENKVAGVALLLVSATLDPSPETESALRAAAEVWARRLEAEARAARRGLWAEANPVPPWEFRH